MPFVLLMSSTDAGFEGYEAGTDEVNLGKQVVKLIGCHSHRHIIMPIPPYHNISAYSIPKFMSLAAIGARLET